MVFVGFLGVLPKLLAVLPMQVGVSIQVRAAKPEIEDDGLLTTMFIVPF